jgi:hypothetical protein
MHLRLAALLAVLHLPLASAADDWQLKVADTEANIQVFSRVNEQGYPEFKGVTRVRSRLSAFVAMFKDIARMPEWAYRVRKAERLKVISETESYMHIVNSLPLPLYDRDVIVHSTITQDAGTLQLSFRGSGVPGFAPKDDQYVRMPVVESVWTFTPLADGMVEVVFQGHGDPGGSLSSVLLAWFVRLSISEAPYHTMLQMKKRVSQPEYQAARYPFIMEPAQ